MLRRLRQLLDASATPAEQADTADRVRPAVAALLVELARADHDEQAAEHAAITGLMERYFHLDRIAAEELVAEARSAVENSVSLREFTAPLHQELSYAEKQHIVGMLWDVALQDQTLDRYEEYLIGKVAELLYVTRGDVVRLRHVARLRYEARPATPQRTPAGT